MSNLFDQFSPAGMAQTARVLGAVDALGKQPAPARKSTTTLDSANAGNGKGDGTTMDAASGEYADQSVSMMAVAVVNEWATTTDLDKGETFADRLVMMLMGIADSDGNGEIGEDETLVIQAAMTAAYGYMVNLGASEEDAAAIFDDGEASASAAERVRDLVAANLPEGDAAEGELLDSVIFTPEDQEPVMDSAYKRKVAIRHGKKVIINKRISGTPHLSPKQKLGLAKARRKANGAAAMARRMKSMRKRQQMGL